MAVDVAYDGSAALERTAVIEYDVVVLDRDLPGRARRRGLPCARRPGVLHPGADADRVRHRSPTGSTGSAWAPTTTCPSRSPTPNWSPGSARSAGGPARRRRRSSCTATCASTRPCASRPAPAPGCRSARRSSPCWSTCWPTAGPGGLGRGTARPGLGRGGRPVHHDGQGDDEPAAGKLGDPPVIETVPRAGYRI